jgi:hypothetical protein
VEPVRKAPVSSLTRETDSGVTIDISEQPRCPDVCWFLDAGNKKAPRAQLTGVQKAPRHEVAGSLAPAKQRALWGLTRQAREVQQWTASELIDGYRFQRRQPGITLPQLPRFGMSVAQEYF